MPSDGHFRVFFTYAVKLNEVSHALIKFSQATVQTVNFGRVLWSIGVCYGWLCADI